MASFRTPSRKEPNRRFPFVRQMRGPRPARRRVRGSLPRGSRGSFRAVHLDRDGRTLRDAKILPSMGSVGHPGTMPLPSPASRRSRTSSSTTTPPRPATRHGLPLRLHRVLLQPAAAPLRAGPTKPRRMPSDVASAVAGVGVGTFQPWFAPRVRLRLGFKVRDRGRATSQARHLRRAGSRRGDRGRRPSCVTRTRV
jgi:hypothetical protein